jgi:signal peptidase I
VSLGNSVIQEISKGPEQGIFPQINEWNRDNLGPIYIPQQGKKTVALNAESLPFYKRIITDYELSDNGEKKRS